MTFPSTQDLSSQLTNSPEKEKESFKDFRLKQKDTESISNLHEQVNNTVKLIV